MAKKQQMYTVDKFLGLNEAEDGLTELKMGEASRIENFYITDGYNLTLRPGIIQNELLDDSDNRNQILGYWRGEIGDDTYALTAYTEYENELVSAISWQSSPPLSDNQSQGLEYLPLGITMENVPYFKIFSFGGKVYIMSESVIYQVRRQENSKALIFENVTFHTYAPIVLTGCSPQGGGTALEPINLLSGWRRVQFSCDGQADSFVLPAEATSISSVELDNAPVDVQTVQYDLSAHTLKLPSVPPEGVNNLVVKYLSGNTASDQTTQRNHRLISHQPYVEAFNGSTDSRLFFYGNGNVTYYTGITYTGEADALYVPAGNEIRVGDSSSPITGMTRHYSKLMVFKPDGTYAITYQPLTLEDGSTIAGFYLRTVNRNVGNHAPGQVQLVNNYPRTVFGGDLYEWRVPASYSVDERYAKRISERIAKSLSAADSSSVVTLCDHDDGTYYIFLNDPEGTILVNRFHLGDVWTMYKYPPAVGVLGADIGAARQNGMPVFWTRTAMYTIQKEEKYDDYWEQDNYGRHPIKALWESGYMHFGADYLRKYSSNIWVSMMPESASKMTVTAATDRRDTYAEKLVGSNILLWNATDFAHWSFNMSPAPKIKRTKLKVKKFVYYKLIFRVDDPGATATILGYDQLVRFSGFVK